MKSLDRRFWKITLSIILLVLAGFLTLPRYLHAESSKQDSDVEVNIQPLPEYKLEQLYQLSDETLGAPVGEVKVNKLVVNYSEVKTGTAFYEFLSKSNREGVVLYCDRDTNSVNIGYRFELDDPKLAERLDGFSIHLIRANSGAIFAHDDNRPAIFNTHQGDTYLSTALLNLADEDQEAYVTFAMRYSDEDDNSLVAGYSPTFKVKDVIAAVKQLPMEACEYVNLTDFPDAMGEKEE